jgi:glycosyltransferase involved in cell wall biosynthesis
MKSTAQKKPPLITTVIPTYRRPEFLKLAIRSVLDQTYSDFILLVCDNLSNDGTKEVVESFNDPRIRYYCQPEHVDIIENFETCLRLVETPYYSMLCDDDFMFPHFYELAVNALEKAPQAAMFVGGTVVVDLDRNIFRKAPMGHDGLWEIRGCPIEQMMTVVSNIVLQACVFRKGEHQNCSRTTHKGGWDEILEWNVVLNYPIVMTSQFVVGYRTHPAQDSYHHVPQADLFLEEKLEKLLVSADEEILEKVRFVDRHKPRMRYAINAYLRGYDDVAWATQKLVKRYYKLEAAVLSVIFFMGKWKVLRQALCKLSILYKKIKPVVIQKKSSENEFSEWINKYSN